MRLPVTSDQLKFLQQIGVEEREYTSAEIEEYVIDKLTTYLTAHGFDDADYQKTNQTGDICEAIIDKIYDSLE